MINDQIVARLYVFIRENIKGGCKKFSLGDKCECPLCDLDRLLEASNKGASMSQHTEPVNRCITELLAFAKDHPGTYIFPSWDGSRVMKYLATSPQSAQTEAALREVVRLSEDAGLYGADFQTEAQQAFIQPPQPYKVSPGRGC